MKIFGNSAKLKHLLLLLMFCAVMPFCIGNETANFTAWTVGGRIYTGFLINHHNNMRMLNEKIPYSYEIFISRATDGKKPWHTFYRYPRYGVSYMLFDLGSPSYLGNAHCVYPFMNFFLTNPERILNVNMRVAAGIAYVEKIFDPVRNYKNAAISTHLNAFLGLGLDGRIRVAAPLHIFGGLAFMHISNGTFKKPNTGLNNIMASAGASYAFGEKKPMLEPTEYSFEKKWNYTAYLSGGVKTYTPYDDTKYATYGLSLEASRTHLAHTSFIGTLDLFYDSSDYADFIRNEKEVKKFQFLKPGFAAGYVFHFGKLSANVQIGRYFFAKKQEHGLIYQRLAMRYKVADRINVHCGLKTHFGQADYIELAIGYKIK